VEPASRFGMWVFLVTNAMSFGALLLAYALLRARAEAWPHLALNLPVAAVATVALAASSLTLLRGRVAATIALGLVFAGAQAFEYATLAHHGVGFGATQAASIFFVATGWHWLHVLAGVVALAVVPRTSSAFASTALFWQFVDAVWIVLFAAFYLVPRVPTIAGVAIGVAAAAGFAAVVFFAMNLRREPRAVRVVFVLPLALPVSFIVALVADALARGMRP
jgi:heme/copper-type cytochrome/quinol oxidase subunit 3